MPKKKTSAKKSSSKPAAKSAAKPILLPTLKTSAISDSHSRDVRELYYLNRLIKHPRVTIGEHSFVLGKPPIIAFHHQARLEIGKFCSIGSDVKFLLGGNVHEDWVSTYPFSRLPSAWPKLKESNLATKGDIVVGNDVFIGTEALILSGVTIGDGAIIGARAVVTKDVPPYTIAAGNPARVRRKRFSDAVISALLSLEWWNWPLEKIRANVEILSSPNIEKLQNTIVKH